MSQIEVPGHSRGDIQKMADRVRTLFGVSPERSFPIVQLLEALGTPFGEDKAPVLEVEIVPDEELPDNYAEYHPISNTMLIRESVYDGACNDNGRDRFTLAHELGHFIIHRNVDYKFARSEEKVESYQDPEWQANTFASMLLIPRDQIAGHTIDEVAEKYQVSKAAARIALSQTEEGNNSQMKKRRIPKIK